MTRAVMAVCALLACVTAGVALGQATMPTDSVWHSSEEYKDAARYLGGVCFAWDGHDVTCRLPREAKPVSLPGHGDCWMVTGQTSYVACLDGVTRRVSP